MAVTVEALTTVQLMAGTLVVQVPGKASRPDCGVAVKAMV